MEIETKVCEDCWCHISHVKTGKCVECGGNMMFKEMRAVENPREGHKALVEDMGKINIEPENVPDHIRLQLRHDVLIYGNGYAERHEDGTWSRIDPRKVRIVGRNVYIRRKCD
jgi:hypothetical protein